VPEFFSNSVFLAEDVLLSIFSPLNPRLSKPALFQRCSLSRVFDERVRNRALDRSSAGTKIQDSRTQHHAFIEFAMFAGVLELGRNPISLVRNVGATHKVRQARNLTVEQFQALLKELPEPFETLALCCATMGLRISKALGLRWEDVDWLGSRINIERAIVAQHVDATKTQGSKKTISIARELLERLRLWKQRSKFRTDTDWVFASPLKVGRLPYSYTGVRQTLQGAADAPESES
jgi:integrase